MNNALENAIEACRKTEGKKQIKLHSYVKGSLFFIEVENDFSEDIAIEEEKAAERQAEKKAVEEAGNETCEYTISVTGTDIKAVAEKVIAAASGTSAPIGASFDIKA